MHFKLYINKQKIFILDKYHVYDIKHILKRIHFISEYIHKILTHMAIAYQQSKSTQKIGDKKRETYASL